MTIACRGSGRPARQTASNRMCAVRKRQKVKPTGCINRGLWLTSIEGSIQIGIHIGKARCIDGSVMGPSNSVVGEIFVKSSCSISKRGRTG